MEINNSLETIHNYSNIHAPKEKEDIVPYFHIYLNLMNVYIDMKDKILENVGVIANNLCFVLKLCKHFMLAFQALQTFFFKLLIPLPLQKIDSSSLRNNKINL